MNIEDKNRITALREQLFQPVFLKTKFDVLYTDVINWSRSGLLDFNFGVPEFEDSYKKTAVCFMEYLWIKIVEFLRDHGFSYDDIILIKKHLSQFVYLNDLNQSIQENELSIDGNLKHEINSILEKNSIAKIQSGLTYFELIIAEAIQKKDAVVFIFTKLYPEFVFPLSLSLQRSLQNKNEDSIVQEILSLPYVSFPIYKLFFPYITNNEIGFSNNRITFLTDDEFNIINLVRRNYNNVTEVKIKFSNGKVNFIDVTSIRKAEVESRLMDFIKRKDYGSIEVKYQDGKISHLISTIKHKL